ncbi:6620_t:CDS:2 [Racocetra persica]|uniref:6620_t:CDS:1 n=1 Tax=Racocetra persica TaxID=160502 RepID=A0ACA9KG91_9GLOM|nr:6620_t:CDS:2 [Racocetra persica]
MDDDNNSEFDINEEDNNDEDSDNDQDNYWDWDSRKKFTRWDYKRCFGEDALKKLYRDQEARQHFILLRFNSFGVLEYNALLDALAYPVKGLNLFEYDELGTLLSKYLTCKLASYSLFTKAYCSPEGVSFDLSNRIPRSQ